MGLIDEFRNTLTTEVAKVWHEMVAEQRYRDIKSDDDCYNTMTQPTPRNVETATKRLVALVTSLDALPLAEHIDRLLGTTAKSNPYVSDLAASLGKGGAHTPATPSVANGQVELLHQQIDVLDRRLEALHDLVQRLGAV